VVGFDAFYQIQALIAVSNAALHIPQKVLQTLTRLFG
jgi:hypothetical protein